MKAAQINTYGQADVIQIVDTDKPVVGDGQVLVEVHGASLNPFDSKIREGAFKDTIPLHLPVTLGGDIAGIVVEAGPGVTHVAAGDEVYGQANAVAGNSGAFAEYAATAGTQIARKPTNIDFMQAAALPLTGLSALQALTEHMQLQAGQKVLIHGGAGGIGTIAIQLAKHLGAYVASTATGEGLDYVRQLGADEVVDYAAQPFEDQLQGYDAVFDTVGGDTYERSFKVLKKGGVIVSMLMPPNAELMEQYEVTAIRQDTRTTVEGLTALTGFVEAGAVTSHVDKVYPLTEVVQAFTDRESGTVKGKIVLKIKD